MIFCKIGWLSPGQKLVDNGRNEEEKNVHGAGEPVAARGPRTALVDEA